MALAGKFVINLMSFFLVSITGHSKDAPPRHYSVRGSDADQLFGVFNGISIIATTYASGIIPEIQVCVAYWHSFFRETKANLVRKLQLKIVFSSNRISTN